MTVHFPIALFISAALFLFIGVIAGSETFHTVAFFNLLLGLITSPATIAAGFLSHRFNYNRQWTGIFVGKLILTTSLITLALIALFVHVFVLESPFETGGARNLYLICVFLMAPNVMGLGFLGGKITFPA